MRILFVIFISLPLYGLSSPGDSVDFTRYDLQRDGSQTACQVWYDRAFGIHVDLMSAHQSGYPDRCCAYNFHLNGWYGRLQVSSERAGYVAIGVKPSNNAAVCLYHMKRSGDIYRCWVAVDDSQGGYAFIEHAVLPQDSSQLIWGKLSIDDQDNFHIVVHSYPDQCSYYIRSTDDGITLEDPMFIDSLMNLSTGVFADRSNTPGKIIIYWTKWTGEGSGGTAQHAQDIRYMISTDYGVTWGPKTNLTQYQPTDTMRAYCHVKAIFGKDGDPHVVFPTGYFVNQTPYNKSWIIHWSPTTGFSFVTGPHEMNNYPGAWRLPCDNAQVAVDPDNGWLYCIYVLCRDSDMSQGGYPNGEIMAKYSTDNGYTWISNALGDTGVNLTKTPTPGAPPGQCCDDDYPSMHPYVETINGKKCLIISYLEDKDAGAIPQGEGTETNNPYRVYVVPVDSIIGVKERPAKKINGLTIPGLVYGNLLRLSGLDKSMKVKIFDILGREVLSRDISPLKSSIKLDNLKSGVYFLRLKAGGHTETRKVVKLR